VYETHEALHELVLLVLEELMASPRQLKSFSEP
jgi:hypothetical protein